MIEELKKMIKMQDEIIQELIISNENYKKSHEAQIKDLAHFAEHIKKQHEENEQLKKENNILTSQQ